MIYAHEHITIDLSGVKGDEDCRMDDRALALEGMRSLRECGVTHLVDMTNRGMGRDPLYAQSVANEAGIGVLHATGYYKEPFLPEECYRLDEQELARIMADELEKGIGDTGIRARVIGEIGSSKGGLTPIEEKLFRAACVAHERTGAPICTHTTLGTAALEQAQLFKAHGVELKRVVLSHLDLCGDTDYMQRVLDTGVNIGFDTVGKNNYQPDESRVQWLLMLVEKGYAEQIVLSMDITRRSNCAGRGGIGYAYLAREFVPMLRSRGMSGEALAALTRENARRIYGIEEA